MTDLFEQSDHRLKGAIEEVAQNIAGSILSKKSLFAIMEQLHGCTSANGSWTQRDAYDLLEAGLALHLSARSTPLLEDVPALSELVDSLDDINAIFEDESAQEEDGVDLDKLEVEYDTLSNERDDLNNPVRELPEEWHGEAGRFLILTNKGEMVLESDYYSEKRLSFEQDEDGNITATSEDMQNVPPAIPMARIPLIFERRDMLGGK